MFQALLIALAAAVGVNGLMSAYEAWLHNHGNSYLVRDGVMGAIGVAAAVVGLVEVIVP